METKNLAMVLNQKEGLLYVSIKPPTNQFLKGLPIWSLGEWALFLKVTQDNIKGDCFLFSTEEMIEVIKSQRADSDAVAAIDCLITSEVNEICFPKDHLYLLKLSKD